MTAAATFEASFTVRGQPKPQPRAHAFVPRKKSGEAGRPRVFTPGTAEQWKSLVVSEGRAHRPDSPLAGPVEVHLCFFAPRPQRLHRRRDPAGEIPHASKPDIDNLAKAVLDALSVDGWWRDDAQVWRLAASKEYVAKGEAPGCSIVVRALGGQS